MHPLFFSIVFLFVFLLFVFQHLFIILLPCKLFPTPPSFAVDIMDSNSHKVHVLTLQPDGSSAAFQHCKYIGSEGWNYTDDKWSWTRLCLLHICNISVTFYSIFNPHPLPAIIPLIFPLDLAVAPSSFLSSSPFLSVNSRLPSSFPLFHTLYFCSREFATVSCRASNPPDMHGVYVYMH